MGKYDSYITKKVLFVRLYYYLLLWSIHRARDDEDEMTIYRSTLAVKVIGSSLVKHPLV